MPPYDDWNRVDDEDDDELQDFSQLDMRRDVILFCIDCSPSMLELREDPEYEDVQTCNLFVALKAAMEIQKKKVIVGPNDMVGILLFNTTRRPDSDEPRTQGSEIKKNTYLYQPISPLDAPTIKKLVNLLEEAQLQPNLLRETFPPVEGKRVAMGDVFTSCNWVLRDGAPKTATKRVFLITDECDPHAGFDGANQQLITSARTTLIDLSQAGAQVEPFFISTEEKTFDVSKFYSSVLLPTNLEEDEDSEDPSVLPEAISISRIEDLLSQMRFHEVPLSSSLLTLYSYGLVTEQKKGQYKYFADAGDGMTVATSKTVYVDEENEDEIDRSVIMYGASGGGAPAPGGDDEEREDRGETGGDGVLSRSVKPGQRPFFTAEEVKKLRSLGMEPSIRLLGFKPKEDLRFEDNIKHSLFIHPDEMTYAGSKRAFNALLKSMIKKNRIGLVLALTRRSSSPMFCALVPQEEKQDDAGWTEPAGFHLIPLPFADDIRAAPVEEGFTANDDLKQLARAWIDKLTIKNGTYPPDSYPNPALAFHNAQLEASAFHEEYDPGTFEDQTEPKYDMIHKRAGALIKTWKEALLKDESANVVIATTGSKRKADVSVDETEIQQRYHDGTLKKLRVDQLKEFLKKKGLNVSGKKDELIERVSDYFDKH